MPGGRQRKCHTPGGLTLRQQAWVAAYLANGGNAAAAARAAYSCKPSSSAAVGHDALTHPTVRAALIAELAARGYDNAGLAGVHATALDLIRSDAPGEKAVAVKALDLAYKLKGLRDTQRNAAITLTNQQLATVLEALQEGRAAIDITPEPRKSHGEGQG